MPFCEVLRRRLASYILHDLEGIIDLVRDGYQNQVAFWDDEIEPPILPVFCFTTFDLNDVANGGIKTILSGGTSFYNLLITTNTATATYSLSDPLYTNNNLTITHGTFNTRGSGNYAVNITSSLYF